VAARLLHVWVHAPPLTMPRNGRICPAFFFPSPLYWLWEPPLPAKREKHNAKLPILSPFSNLLFSVFSFGFLFFPSPLYWLWEPPLPAKREKHNAKLPILSPFSDLLFSVFSFGFLFFPFSGGGRLWGQGAFFSFASGGRSGGITVELAFGRPVQAEVSVALLVVGCRRGRRAGAVLASVEAGLHRWWIVGNGRASWRRVVGYVDGDELPLRGGEGGKSS